MIYWLSLERRASGWAGPVLVFSVALVVQHGALTQRAHWQGGRKSNEAFPGGTVVQNPSDNATDETDVCLIPGLGRSPGEGNSNPIFLPGKFHGRGVWWTAAHRVAKSQTQLND